MSQILNRVRDADPNDSEAVKEVLTAFFQKLSKHKDINSEPHLQISTLEYIINRFPKYCGQYRAMIENYLSFFLDSNNYYNVIKAAKCAHAVQQVRPQHEKTASAKTCWRDQMAALCEAAHTLVGTLFTKSAKIYNNNVKTQKNTSQTVTSPLHSALADITAISNAQDVTNKSDLLCTRLRNVLVFIQAMMVEIYPVAKPIRPQLVLEVILQALSASGSEDSAKVTTVKLQALRTLDATIACLGSNLIPFSALVFRFVMQTLRWSSEHVSEDTRKVRCAAYVSLTRWLRTLRVHSDGADRQHSWHADLTSHVAGDVTPPKHLVQLTANGLPMKNLSKKARKKLANSMLMQSNISSHAPGEKNKIKMSEESNDEVAIAALECTETFLTTCGIFLKPTIHKQFQELLVRECYNIDSCSPERGIWLVRTLEASRKSCSAKVPPPTQYCLQLYSVLINSSHPEISKMSSQALLDIRMHLHCSPPSLNFALQEKPDDKRDDKRKRVSERNRAVLEGLLGKERMPSEDIAEEEIITIPDEPSSKRPRIDEEAEKISLSSDSAASVEISDSSSVEEVQETGPDSNETDYIIEPDMNTEFEFQETGTRYIGNVERVDETDGQEIENVNDDDVSTIQITQEVAIFNTDAIDDDNVEQNDEANEKEKKNDDDDADTIVLTQKDNNKRDIEIDSSQKLNIFEAKTQMPLVSNEATADKSPPLSMEVAYDYPSTGQEKITVLDKMDEDNLPSTNDTDDVQITCGQTVESSQNDSEVKEPENEIPKNNGIDKSPQRIVENGDACVDDIESNVAVKIVSNDVEVTVEDMLADFVDEVNDETQTPA